MVEEAVDEDPLADVERRLHRFGGDLVRLDDPGLDRQRQPQGQRNDDDQLDEPAAFALPASGSRVSGCRVLVGVAGLGRLLVLGILGRCSVLGLPGLGRFRVRLRRRLGLCLRLRLARASASPPAPLGLARLAASSAWRLLGLGRASSASTGTTSSWPTPSASTAVDSPSARRRPRRRRRRSPSAARRRGRPCRCGRAGSRASPGARRRAPRPRVSRSSASAAGTSARRRRQRTACAREGLAHAEPWRLRTTPSKTWVRLRVPSITWKWTRTRSPGAKLGRPCFSWARSMLSITELICEKKPPDPAGTARSRNGSKAGPTSTQPFTAISDVMLTCSRAPTCRLGLLLDDLATLPRRGVDAFELPELAAGLLDLGLGGRELFAEQLGDQAAAVGKARGGDRRARGRGDRVRGFPSASSPRARSP